MRGPRRPEDLPRLLVALGLAEPGPDSASGSGAGPREVASPVRDGDGGADRVTVGLEYWLPTADSLDAATRPAGGDPPAAPSGVRGTPEPRGPRVIRAPDALVGSRRAVPVRTVVAVLAVVAVAAAIFGARVLVARADGRPAPVSSSSTDGIVGRASPTFSGPAAGSGSASPAGSTTTGVGTPVVVDVVGQVRHPGVYTLRSGQRVADAVKAAGGVVAPSDVAAVNLARVLVDGEQIRVPKPGEPPVVSTAPSGSGASSGSAGSLVNLNTADLTALDGLPGVGPVLAQRILDWRAAHGRFTSVEELGEVSGIGEKLLGQLRTKVTVS